LAELGVLFVWINLMAQLRTTSRGHERSCAAKTRVEAWWPLPSGGRLAENRIFEFFVVLNLFYLPPEFDFPPGGNEIESLEMGVLKSINCSIFRIANLHARVIALGLLELGLPTHQESGFRAEREALFAARSGLAF